MKGGEGYTNQVEGQRKIHARDYKLLNVPEPTPCFVWSFSWSQYIERLTPEQRKAPLFLGREQVE
jgi:hypothetical protein